MAATAVLIAIPASAVLLPGPGNLVTGLTAGGRQGLTHPHAPAAPALPSTGRVPPRALTRSAPRIAAPDASEGSSMTQHLAAALHRPPTSHRAVAPDWWRDAVIYQVYPRSFADSNGDGMGDLRASAARLPYLRDLGVDAVWLSPFYASPQADAGYDVADYRAVDPMFGTLLDADALIRDAHDLGLRIIVDLVPNHSSDQHEWFKRALAEGPGSAAAGALPLPPRQGRERRTARPTTGSPSSAAPPGPGSPSPTARPASGTCTSSPPSSPTSTGTTRPSRDEFRSILRFWLDMGVDGFRIDVAHGLVKAEGLPDLGAHDQLKLLGNDVMPFFDQDGVHEIYRTWRTILDEYAGERIFVAEAWTPTVERTANYVRPDELHQAFNFQYLGTHWDAAELREVIDARWTRCGPVGAPATWVLSNHDVTRHATRFANPPGLGTQIRDRPATAELGLRRARAATLLMLALPGSAYLYQGEELGLPDVVDLPDEVRQDPAYFRARGPGRLPRRLPGADPVDRARARRTASATGGSWLPQPDGWAELSVEAQTGDPGSTLELYRAALAVRREQPGLGAGDAVEWLDAPEGVLAFRRRGRLRLHRQHDRRGGADTRAPAGCCSPAARSPSTDGEAKLPADTTVWWAV